MDIKIRQTSQRQILGRFASKRQHSRKLILSKVNLIKTEIDSGLLWIIDWLVEEISVDTRS